MSRIMISIKNNENYAASVVKIKNKIDCEGLDNLKLTMIHGNPVLISKDVEIGTIGLYFPSECQISDEFLKENNLYRDKTLNKDTTKKGYFEKNGRVRLQSFKGNPSDGMFVGLEYLNYLDIDTTKLEVGDVFDTINNKELCKKYIVKLKSNVNNSSKKKGKKVSKLIDGQFNFHYDTGHLGKNFHLIELDDVISITKKLHGTSGVSSYILCKKRLSWKDRFAKWLGASIKEVDYDYIYSSRKVVKNSDLNKDPGYYSENIWKLAHDRISSCLQKGMTFYYEIVGYIPGGKMIQKDYDYGCRQNEFEVYVYRITYTNPDGKIYEFSAKQVQEYCKIFGLNPVPELYYGTLYNTLNFDISLISETDFDAQLSILKNNYLEKDCDMCKNNVPDEGVVIRNESKPYLPAYKLKSFRFKNHEAKLIDSGEEDIEENNN